MNDPIAHNPLASPFPSLRIWLTATLLALAMEVVWGDPLGGGSSGRNPAKPRASAQIYPLADREGNSLYALPPKLTGEMIQSLARTRHWRPYQAIGTSYDVARKPGQSSHRGELADQAMVTRSPAFSCNLTVTPQ